MELCTFKKKTTKNKQTLFSYLKKESVLLTYIFNE